MESNKITELSVYFYLAITHSDDSDVVEKHDDDKLEVNAMKMFNKGFLKMMYILLSVFLESVLRQSVTD